MPVAAVLLSYPVLSEQRRRNSGLRCFPCCAVWRTSSSFPFCKRPAGCSALYPNTATGDSGRIPEI